VSTRDELLRRRLLPIGGWQPSPLRAASVLCPLVAIGGHDHLLLVVRPRGQAPHAGQIAFPGGMRQGDETPLATALRECHEEVGVAATAVAPLGALAARESSTGVLAHCIVGRIEDGPLLPDPREVDRVLRVPLDDLLDEVRWSEQPPPQGAGGAQPRTSPHFWIGDDLLWGLTARFVRDLLLVLRPE
jgi:8-oxo-dGTP pyrophosphatase MutT (NUDIX family)